MDLCFRNLLLEKKVKRSKSWLKSCYVFVYVSIIFLCVH